MNQLYKIRLNRMNWDLGLLAVLAMVLTVATLARAQVPQSVNAATGPVNPLSVPNDDRSVVAIVLSDRGLACATKTQDDLLRHAQEGYAAGAELGTKSPQGEYFSYRLESQPEQLLDEARKNGCATIVTDSDQAGLIVASLVASRTQHRVLPQKSFQAAISALLGVLGVERYDHLRMLEALPKGGEKDDLQALLRAGVGTSEQLVSLKARIAKSGYSTTVDIDSLRQFLADDKEGGSTGKTAYQVKQAREAAEAAAEKARQEAEAAAEKARIDAEEKKKKDLESAKNWEAIKGGGILLAIVVGFGLMVYVAWGTSTKCPSCQKWFAQNTLQSIELGRQTGYETETRSDKFKNNRGEVIGTLERQEQVRVTHVQYQNFNQCKFCSYQWHSQSTSKFKG